MIVLARHASCDGLGARLNGRSKGAPLSSRGREEAARLAARLATLPVSRLLASPRERCLQTAEAIAAKTGLTIETDDNLDEVDFGDWTGRDFAALESDPAWRDWNRRRSRAKAPGGESMADVQRRMTAALTTAARAPGVCVLISHAEPIRAALAAILGFSLDVWARLEISPAGYSRLAADPLRIRSVNETLP